MRSIALNFILGAPYVTIQALSSASKLADSVAPHKLAFALEDIKIKGLFGDVEMRKSDHQAQQAMILSTWTKVNGKTVKYDQEKTGYGWKTTDVLDVSVSAQPSSCQMKRPLN